MTSEVIKEYVALLGFKVDDKSLASFKTALKSTAKQVAVGAAAVSAAAYAAFKFVDAQADSLDKLNDLSTKLNTPADAIERVAYGAGIMGSSAEAAKSSMEGLNVVLGQAALGLGRGAKTFEKLGLKARKSNGEVKNTAEIMDDVREKLTKMGRAEQLATLSKLGIDSSMVEYLTSDVAELNKEFDALYKSVGVNLNDAGKASGNFRDATDKLKGTFTALFQAVALRMMPAMTKGIEDFTAWMKTELPRLMPTILSIIDGFMRLGGVIGTVGKLMLNGLAGIRDLLIVLDEKTNGWSSVFARALVFVGGLILAWFFAPLAAVIGVLTTIGLLYDDIVTSMSGGESLLPWQGMYEWVMKTWDAVKQFFSDLAGYWTQFKSFFEFKLPEFGFGGGGSTAFATPGFADGGGAPPRTSPAGGAQQTNNNDMTINITTADNPQAIASGVSRSLSDANAAAAARNQSSLTR